MNKVFLIGNLTRDPETSTTASGVQMCRFSIAVNRPFANAEGVREVVDDVEFLTPRSGEGGSAPFEPSAGNTQSAPAHTESAKVVELEPVEDTDLPF